MKFRIHLLGIPHTVSSKLYNACAFTSKVVKFGKMMKGSDCEIIHYGHEDSDLICDEHVTVTTNDDLMKAYGTYDWKRGFFKHSMDDWAHQTFAANAIKEIQKRKQKNDFLLAPWGLGHKRVTDCHNDLICMEPGIGYPTAPICRWRVYESYSILHASNGIENVAQCKQDFYHVVIPNYFDLDDFEYSEQKEDYFLFLGRCYSGKGLDIAIETTAAMGKKLIVSGQTDGSISFPSHVEYVGYSDIAQRKKLMSKAKGFFLATKYLEPFGGSAIESLISGTPIITTDFGVFNEYNTNSVTGYRCRVFNDFCKAVESIDRGEIKSADCRKVGLNYSLEAIRPQYIRYFTDVMNVHCSDGWYTRY